MFVLVNAKVILIAKQFVPGALPPAPASARAPEDRKSVV